MKTIAGDASLACANRSRTRDAPMPAIASTNSEADIEKNGTRLAGHGAREQRLAGAGPAAQQDAAWDAAAEPSVLAPGRAGSRRSRTSSALASSIPATSAKVTVSFARLVAAGRERPKLLAVRGRPNRRKIQNRRSRNMIVGPNPKRRLFHTGMPSGGVALTTTPLLLEEL